VTLAYVQLLRSNILFSWGFEVLIDWLYSKFSVMTDVSITADTHSESSRKSKMHGSELGWTHNHSRTLT